MQDSRITSKLIPVNLSLQIQPYLSVVDEIKRDTNFPMDNRMQNALKLMHLHPCCPMSILCNIAKAYFFLKGKKKSVANILKFIVPLLSDAKRTNKSELWNPFSRLAAKLSAQC